MHFSNNNTGIHLLNNAVLKNNYNKLIFTHHRDYSLFATKNSSVDITTLSTTGTTYGDMFISYNSRKTVSVSKNSNISIDNALIDRTYYGIIASSNSYIDIQYSSIKKIDTLTSAGETNSYAAFYMDQNSSGIAFYNTNDFPGVTNFNKPTTYRIINGSLIIVENTSIPTTSVTGGSGAIEGDIVVDTSAGEASRHIWSGIDEPTFDVGL